MEFEWDVKKNEVNKKARNCIRGRVRTLSLRVNRDVLEWFKSHSKDYRHWRVCRAGSLLRMEAQRFRS